MSFDKIKFGIRDVIYIISIVFAAAGWYITYSIQENKYKMLVENFGEELEQVTTFMNIQVKINEGINYHMKDKNIHRNLNNEEND